MAMSSPQVVRHSVVPPRPSRLEFSETKGLHQSRAVGLLGVSSAKQMGAERIIAMSRHEKRQKPDRNRISRH
jgi:hypothetical protein